MARNWKKLGIISLGIMVGLFVLVGGGMAYTSRGEFCAKCHEISPLVTTWKRFPHKDVPCLDCHANPGKVGYVVRKIEAYKEVYKHITGNYNFKTIQARVNQKNCINCHSGKENFPNAKNIYQEDTTKRFNFNHKDHLGEKIDDKPLQCLNCHKHITHGSQPLHPEKSTIRRTHKQVNCGECHENFRVEGDPNKWEFTDECKECHKTDLRNKNRG